MASPATTSAVIGDFQVPYGAEDTGLTVA